MRLRRKQVIKLADGRREMFWLVTGLRAEINVGLAVGSADRINFVTFEALFIAVFIQVRLNNRNV